MHLHKNNHLCGLHFEISQFINRINKNRLIPKATPTLFDISNPPSKILSSRKKPLERNIIFPKKNLKKIPVMSKIFKRIILPRGSLLLKENNTIINIYENDKVLINEGDINIYGK